MSNPLLTVSGVSKRFGGLQALSEVELTIEPGQVHGLIGPNGAGKTTFFNVITGLVPADRGRFTLAGRAYRPTEVHKVTLAKQVLKDYTPDNDLFPGYHIPKLQEEARKRFKKELDELKDAYAGRRAAETA